MKSLGHPRTTLTHTSSKYTSKGALNKAWNQASINSQMSKKAVDAAMGSINNVLNDRFCFSKKTRADDHLSRENDEEGQLHGSQ